MSILPAAMRLRHTKEISMMNYKTLYYLINVIPFYAFLFTLDKLRDDLQNTITRDSYFRFSRTCSSLVIRHSGRTKSRLSQ